MFSKQDAQRGQFDLVLAEALDRMSRDQAGVATLFKHLCFAGVPIVTSAEGEISELHLAPKGTMNALSARLGTPFRRTGQQGECRRPDARRR
jgi:hypothetical protein